MVFRNVVLGATLVWVIAAASPRSADAQLPPSRPFLTAEASLNLDRSVQPIQLDLLTVGQRWNGETILPRAYFRIANVRGERGIGAATTTLGLAAVVGLALFSDRFSGPALSVWLPTISPTWDGSGAILGVFRLLE